MNPYFYSLGMLVSSPAIAARPLTMMDLLAQAIADEEVEPPKRLTDWIESCQKYKNR